MNFHKRVNQFLAGVNQFLAELVSAINALVAIGIPVLAALVAGGLAGSSFGRFSLMGFLGGFIAGGVAGILIAGSVCGVVAVLVDIRNSLAAQATPRSEGDLEIGERPDRRGAGD